MKYKNLSKEYTDHYVFKQLIEYEEFYNDLSFSTMNWVPQGTKAWINLDVWVFKSIAGTIDSIRLILYEGRINDSYALLRKYFDSTLINIYTNLYLRQNYSFENLIVDHIENWRNGSQKLPRFREISRYIKESDRLKPIKELLESDNRYTSIRERCNDHTHYNYYHNLLSNDNGAYDLKRIDRLNTFSEDLKHIFVQHISYIFYLEDLYMMSSDYQDSLDCGLEPEPDSEFYVAPFVQDMFNKILKKERPDLFQEIVKTSKMFIE